MKPSHVTNVLVSPIPIYAQHVWTANLVGLWLDFLYPRWTIGFHFPTADRLEMELMLLTRWANIALATNFDSSELLGADSMGTGEPLQGKNLPVTLRVVECTCQDSRGWWSGFDPLGPSWHRHRPAPELHPGRWAVGRQHPRPGLPCTNLFTTCLKTCQNPYSQNVLFIENLKLFVVVRLLPK